MGAIVDDFLDLLAKTRQKTACYWVVTMVVRFPWFQLPWVGKEEERRFREQRLQGALPFV